MNKKKRNQLESTSLEQEMQDLVQEETPVMTPSVEEPKIDFDAWYALRQSKIPAHHHKEIIKADFVGRKVPLVATIAEFDMALKKYGLPL